MLPPALALAACIATTQAADIAPTLTIEGARAMLASAGVREGAEFVVGLHRFRVSHLSARSPRPWVFQLEIGVEPIGER